MKLFSSNLPRYLPAIGRFLIVVTFIEDALRIITQWNDQLVYLKDFRHSMASSLCTKLSDTSSSLGSHPYLPHLQCDRHVQLFDPRHPASLQ